MTAQAFTTECCYIKADLVTNEMLNAKDLCIRACILDAVNDCENSFG